MNSEIAFSDRRRVNLADGVTPEVYAELEGMQGRGSRVRPLLFCGTCGSGVYIRHGSARRNKLFGAHFPGGSCPADLTIRKSAMTLYCGRRCSREAARRRLQEQQQEGRLF